MKMKSESEVAQSCLTLSDPMDCSLLGSSVHGIFQARVLEWGAIAFSDNISHVSLKSVTTQINHSKKAISHQVSDFEHVAHTPSANHGLEELAAPTNNHSSLSINLNSSHGKVKDVTQSLIQTEAGLPKGTCSIKG